MRKIALFLVVVFMGALLSGCIGSSDKDGETSKTTKAPDTGETKPTSNNNFDENGYAEDTVVDMDGYEFVIGSPMMRNKAPNNATLAERLYHKRFDEVEEAYNCKIKIKTIYPDTATLMPMILAGEKIADVLEQGPSMWIPSATAGYLTAWEDVPNINLEDARWIKSFTATTNLGGKHWGVQFVRPPEIEAVFFYNKNALKNANITEDPTELVKKGEWTFEKFREMAKATTKDVDNDGKIDTYGLDSIDPSYTAWYFITANGGKLVSQDADGNAIPTYTDQKVVNALNFYDQLVNTDRVVKLYDNMSSVDTWNNMPSRDDILEGFRSSNVAFLSARSWVGNIILKELMGDVPYGMVPVPNGPDGDGSYASHASELKMFTVPSTNKDLDKTSIIFNAIARPSEGYEGEEWWKEEVQKEYFQADDTGSLDMYTIGVENESLDLGIGVLDIRLGFMGSAVLSPIFFRETTPAAAIQEIAGTLDESIKAVYTWRS